MNKVSEEQQGILNTAIRINDREAFNKLVQHIAGEKNKKEVVGIEMWNEMVKDVKNGETINIYIPSQPDTLGLALRAMRTWPRIEVKEISEAELLSAIKNVE